MKKIISVMLILLFTFFITGCGNTSTNSQTSKTNSDDINTSTQIDNSSSKEESSSTTSKQITTSTSKIEASSSKKATPHPTSSKKDPPQTNTPSTNDNDLNDVDLFLERYNNLWSYIKQILNTNLTTKQDEYNQYSTYIANNSTIDQSTYFIRKRQIDEQYANAGLYGSGQHQFALKSLEQQYLVEQNPVVIQYKDKLLKLSEEIEELKELINNDAELEEFVISQLCEDYGYDEEAAYQMLYSY